MVTDPIGDFLTRIRNAQTRGQQSVVLPSSKMLVGIAGILKEEGFVEDFSVENQEPQNVLTVTLKYVDKVPGIRELKRVSRPGIRKYRGYKEIKTIKQGMGVSIFSTPMGVMTGQSAVKNRVGGEYICDIY
jgi:small subunit ribosomal protein S8